MDRSSDEADGPWEYRDSTKVTIHYSMIDQENLNPRFINLKNLLKRGFPKCLAPKRFKYYSWLRFKYYANEESTIDKVLSSEELFLQLLKKVNNYYVDHKNLEKYHEQEGLEEYKGPPKFCR